jgi:hypothetical protein
VGLGPTFQTPDVPNEKQQQHYTETLDGRKEGRMKGRKDGKRKNERKKGRRKEKG